MIKKDLVIAVIVTFCLTATLFMIMPTRSQYSKEEMGVYDPWIDLNDDGSINLFDGVMLSSVAGTSGDPTKSVSVANWPSEMNINVANWDQWLIVENQPLSVAMGSTFVPQSQIRNSDYVSVEGFKKFMLYCNVTGLPPGQYIMGDINYLNAGIEAYGTQHVSVYAGTTALGWFDILGPEMHVQFTGSSAGDGTVELTIYAVR